MTFAGREVYDAMVAGVKAPITADAGNVEACGNLRGKEREPGWTRSLRKADPSESAKLTTAQRIRYRSSPMG